MSLRLKGELEIVSPSHDVVVGFVDKFYALCTIDEDEEEEGLQIRRLDLPVVLRQESEQPESSMPAVARCCHMVSSK